MPIPKEKQNIDLEELRNRLDYDPSTGILTWKIKRRSVNPGDRAGCIARDGYRKITYNNQIYPASVLIWFWMTGVWPFEVVDHKNRIKDDNRWLNLRLATQRQNTTNSRTKLGDRRGIQEMWGPRAGTRYRVGMCVEGKRLEIGLFKSLEEAKEAYRSASIKYRKEFHPEYLG